MKKISLVKLLAGLTLAVSLSTTSLVGCGNSAEKYNDREILWYGNAETGEREYCTELEFKQYYAEYLPEVYDVLLQMTGGFESAHKAIDALELGIEAADIHDDKFKDIMKDTFEDLHDVIDMKEKGYDTLNEKKILKADKKLVKISKRTTIELDYLYD